MTKIFIATFGCIALSACSMQSDSASQRSAEAKNAAAPSSSVGSEATASPTRTSATTTSGTKIDEKSPDGTGSTASSTASKGWELTLPFFKNFNRSVLRCQQEQNEAACSEVGANLANIKAQCSGGDKNACPAVGYAEQVHQGIEEFQRKCVRKELNPLIPDDKRQEMMALTKSYCEDASKTAAGLIKVN